MLFTPTISTLSHDGTARFIAISVRFLDVSVLVSIATECFAGGPHWYGGVRLHHYGCAKGSHYPRLSSGPKPARNQL